MQKVGVRKIFSLDPLAKLTPPPPSKPWRRPWWHCTLETLSKHVAKQLHVDVQTRKHMQLLCNTIKYSLVRKDAENCLYLVCINVLLPTVKTWFDVTEIIPLSGNFASTISQLAAGDWHFVRWCQVTMFIVSVFIGAAAAQLHTRHNDSALHHDNKYN